MDAGGCAAASAVSWDREQTTDIHQIFGGTLQSSLICHRCKHVSIQSESFLDLSLEISQVQTLQEALAHFTDPEILQGDNSYRCNACQGFVTAVKRFSIRRAPNVLMLHLKRFDRYRKDIRSIEFPEQLNLSPFMFGKPPGLRVRYILSAVLVHQGSSRQFGHYTAYVRSAEGQWLLKDDSSSRVVPLSTVLRQQAYILFYSRIVGRSTTTARLNNIGTKISSENLVRHPSVATVSSASSLKAAIKPQSSVSVARRSSVKRAAVLTSSIRSLNKQPFNSMDEAPSSCGWKTQHSSKTPTTERLNNRMDGSKEGRIAYSTRNAVFPNRKNGSVETAGPMAAKQGESRPKGLDAGNEKHRLLERSSSAAQTPKKRRVLPKMFRRLSPLGIIGSRSRSPRTSGQNSPEELCSSEEDAAKILSPSGKDGISSEGDRTSSGIQGSSDQAGSTCAEGFSLDSDDAEGRNSCVKRTLKSRSGSARKAVRRAFGMFGNGKGEPRRSSESDYVSCKEDSCVIKEGRLVSRKGSRYFARSLIGHGKPSPHLSRDNNVGVAKEENPETWKRGEGKNGYDTSGNTSGLKHAASEKSSSGLHVIEQSCLNVGAASKSKGQTKPGRLHGVKEYLLHNLGRSRENTATCQKKIRV